MVLDSLLDISSYQMGKYTSLLLQEAPEGSSINYVSPFEGGGGGRQMLMVADLGEGMFIDC